MIVCRTCQTQNADSQSYCTKCGRLLVGEPGEPSQSADASGGTPGAPVAKPGVAKSKAVKPGTVKKAGTRPGGAATSATAADGSGRAAVSGAESLANGGQAAGPSTGTTDDRRPPEDGPDTPSAAHPSAGSGEAVAEGAGFAGSEAAATGGSSATTPTERIIIRSQPVPTSKAHKPPTGEPLRTLDPEPTITDPGPSDTAGPVYTIGPDEIACPKCGRPNPISKTWCQYDSTLLRPALPPEPIETPTGGGGIHVDPRMAGIGAVLVAVVVIALAVLLLRPKDDQVAVGPSVLPSQSAAVGPSPSATSAESGPPPSASPSTEPSSVEPPKPSGRLAYDSVVSGNSEIFTVNADGSNAVKFTTSKGQDWDPDLSMDGMRLTWSSPAGIQVASLDGSEAFQLTHHQDQDFNPAWSPDGERIAYSSTRDHVWEIYVREAFDGAGSTDTIRLTTSGEADFEPSWSPDGKNIVFTRGEGGKADIFTLAVPAIGAKPTAKAVALTKNDNKTIEDEDPAWSADGAQIAFSRTTGNGQADLYVLTLETKDVRRVTSTSGVDEHDPAWSPDGAYLAYQADGVIEIVAVATGEVVSTLELPGQASHATWR